MEPIDYARAVGRRWVSVLVLGLLGGAAAWGYASTQPTLYKSTSSVFVSSERGETTSELVQSSTFTQNLVQSYSQLATMPAVLDPVIDRLGLDVSAQELAASVTSTTPLNTVIIEITVQQPTPTDAARVAEAITASLASTVQSLAPRGPGNAPSISLDTVSSAEVPSAPFSPNVPLIVATGLLAGLALGVAYALARELLATRVRTEQDLFRVTDVPLLGTVSRKRRDEAGGLVMRTAPSSARAEDYRRVRANLEFIDIDRRPHSVVITSPVPNDGKTTTALNLALALAERSPRVLLVDADLRRPTVASMCGIEGAVGLTTVLVGAVAAGEAITRWGDVLDILPSGSVPPNPGQLLGSAAMSELLAQLSVRYDFIVIDAPPLLPATDALGLARLADGAIVVARAKATRRVQLAKTLEALDAVNARALGIVLNQVRATRREEYYGPVAPPAANAPTQSAEADPAPVAEPAPSSEVVTAGTAGSPAPTTGGKRARERTAAL